MVVRKKARLSQTLIKFTKSVNIRNTWTKKPHHYNWVCAVWMHRVCFFRSCEQIISMDFSENKLRRILKHVCCQFPQAEVISVSITQIILPKRDNNVGQLRPSGICGYRESWPRSESWARVASWDVAVGQPAPPV